MNDSKKIANLKKSFDNIKSVSPDLKVYVGDLPSPDGRKVDPDSFLRHDGAEALKRIIDEAPRYSEYELNNLFKKDIQTPKEQDRVIVEILKIAEKIEDPIEQDIFYKKSINALHNKGIFLEITALDEKQELLILARKKEERRKKLEQVFREGTDLMKKGRPGEAFGLMREQTQLISQSILEDNSDSFSKLLTRENILKELSNRPESLDTGYRVGYDALMLPSGAVAIICGPTSHGKTTVLINVFIKVAHRNPDKMMIFISLEENRAAIFIKSLNTYADLELSKNNRATLYGYYKGGTNQFIKTDVLPEFEKKEEEFFKEFLESGRINIQYTDDDVESILDKISYLIKNAQVPVGAVFIDYMQLLHLSKENYRFNSRQEELKKICLLLKDFAVNTQLPIVLGAQFNREVNNLLALDPTRIGEAGDIERIANLIIGIWNNNFSGITTSQEDKIIERMTRRCPKGIFVKILKNRDGAVGGEDLLHFDGNTGRISNIDEYGQKEGVL